MTFTCSVKGFVCIERFGFQPTMLLYTFSLYYLLFIPFSAFCAFLGQIFMILFSTVEFLAPPLCFFFSIHILVPFKIQHSILNLLLSTFKYVTSVLWKDLKIVYFHFFVIFVWLCKNEKKVVILYLTHI